MSIEVRGLRKKFGVFAALDGVSVAFPTGELVALLGPSGSGKTTLLRVIAGLEAPDDGEILFDGENATHRDVRDRQVGFVFQHYALFRHLTVFENVAFGLRVKPRAVRPTDAQIRTAVMDLLKLVQLDWLADRYPAQLSGGQRQRVALARALAVKPGVLLLDEPFGALDARVRKELRRWLRRLHEEMPITTAFVTHDQEEAMEVADRIVVMNEGRIEQVGPPEDVYERPATPFVYSFLGDVNLFHGRVTGGRAQVAGTEWDVPEWGGAGDGDAVAYVRTWDVELTRQPDGERSIETVLRHVRRYGPMVRLELDRVDDGQVIQAEIPRARFEELALALGNRVFVKPRNPGIFPNPRG